MKRKVLLFSLCLASCFANSYAEEAASIDKDNGNTEKTTEEEPKKKSRLTLGGYGEAVFSKNYYSDSYLRYNSAEAAALRKNESHSRFDLPHVVIYLGYDFGNGWTMGSEIEFEHGGTESAVEIEEEEGGEYESEIERGGEVALEQFWIQKSFFPQLNVKMGHFVVPIGATNQHHMPTEFFTVYRPEGENTIMPCTWHETGISVWGNAGKWRYEAMLISGLDSERFGRKGWVHDGSASPYEFKIANCLAGAFRVDNRSIKGLRLSLSGYVGNSFHNTLRTPSASYNDVKGTVTIGAFDFLLDRWNWIARGNFDYGHLTDSKEITEYNKSFSKDSPSPKQSVASDAIAAGIEVGYNVFSQIAKQKDAGRKLYIFGRYEYYDSMYKTASSVSNFDYCGRSRIAAGVNYFPMKDIVLKGEYSIGLMKKPFNNEPSISLGVAYSGFFNM